MAANPTKVVLRIRANHEYPWVNNFMAGGWRVRTEDGKWVKMNDQNTRIRNPFYDETDPDSVLWLTPVETVEVN